MDGTEDPVLGRLDDALSRVNKIEERATKGESIPNSVIISEMRAIREDMLAERRDTSLKRKELDARLANYLPRQPAISIMRWVVAFITTVGAAWSVWYLTGRG